MPRNTRNIDFLRVCFPKLKYKDWANRTMSCVWVFYVGLYNALLNLISFVIHFWGLPLTQCTANWLNSLYGIGAGRHSKALGGFAYTQRKRTTMLCSLLAWQVIISKTHCAKGRKIMIPIAWLSFLYTFNAMECVDLSK